MTDHIAASGTNLVVMAMREKGLHIYELISQNKQQSRQLLMISALSSQHAMMA